MLTWDGMPALLPLSEADRHQWLQSYGYTFVLAEIYKCVRTAGENVQLFSEMIWLFVASYCCFHCNFSRKGHVCNVAILAWFASQWSLKKLIARF
jgi:hypothetical protein